MAYLSREEEKLMDNMFNSIADFIEDELPDLPEDKIKFYLGIRLVGNTGASKRNLPDKLDVSFYKEWDKAYDYVMWGKRND